MRDVQPSYPASAREDGAEGQVTVGYQISEEGRVDQVRITRSSGDSRLDSAAVQAAERLRYEPELQEGRAIRSRARRTFLFKLGE
ncbi:MAG TPA: energy transducer TonB [Armatimonadota bacterium]